MTPAEGRAWKKKLAKENAKEIKIRARLLLSELRQAIRDPKVEKKQKRADAKTICKSARVAARERAKRLREEARLRLLEAIRLEREGAKTACDTAKAIAASLGDEIARRREKLHAERKYQREMRRIEAANRAGKKSVRTASKKERTSESDDEVRANLPPELVRLFDRVKGIIKGSAHRSRTEAMIEYADAHPDEVIRAQEDAADDRIAELEKRQREAEDMLARPLAYARLAREKGWLASEAVPF